jgi:hypothetical protein
MKEKFGFNTLLYSFIVHEKVLSEFYFTFNFLFLRRKLLKQEVFCVTGNACYESVFVMIYNIHTILVLNLTNL